MLDYRWKDCSKYRDEIYGLAIISVMLLHYFDNVAVADDVSTIWRLFARVYNGVIGSVGVDIFVFFSGFGICYSLSKKPKLFQFYYRRIKRVIIPYLFLGGIFWIVKDLILNNASVMRFLIDYSLLSFWSEGLSTFWYVAFICVLYLVSPLLFSFSEKKILWECAIAVLFLVFFYLLFPVIFDNLEIALLRIPVFFVGMYCGSLSLKGASIGKKLPIFLAFSVPAKVLAGLFDLSFARIISGAYGLFLILLYVLIRNTVFQNSNQVTLFLSRAGKYTLEFYIVHIAIRNIMNTMGLNVANLFVYSFCILLTVLISVSFTKLQSKVMKP